MEKVCLAKFTSVWDGGYKVTSPCKVNTETKEVFDIEPYEGIEDFVETLDEQYITVMGNEYSVSDNRNETEYWYA